MSHKTAAVILLAAVAAILMLHLKPTSEQTSFEQWKVEHGKTYPSQFEEAYRKTVFLKKVAEVAVHNADKTNAYEKGINQFSDLTQDEFAAKYLTLKVKAQVHSRTMQDSNINGDIDWVAAGKVTPVKNQAQCGSCWAFSAVAAIESGLLVAGQGATNLSEQQLVDCSRSYGNQGCNGGWMDSAFQYVRDKGLTTTQAYPYVARDQACAIDSGSVKIKSFVDVPGCDNLWNALSGRPVSVAVDASNWSSYKSGVFSTCGTAVNHGVLLVGATDNYWVIKNSWATGWGENGFIRLARGNTCAICGYPSYPTW